MPGDNRRAYRDYDDRGRYDARDGGMQPYDDGMYRSEDRRGRTGKPAQKHHTHRTKKTTTYKTNTMSTLWALDEPANRCLSSFLLVSPTPLIG